MSIHFPWRINTVTGPSAEGFRRFLIRTNDKLLIKVIDTPKLIIEVTGIARYDTSWIQSWEMTYLGGRKQVK
jgi:hypothetical protein